MTRYHRLGRWAKRNRTRISAVSFLLVVCVITPATLIKFPDTTYWLGALIVGLYALDQLKDLIDQIEDDYEDGV